MSKLITLLLFSSILMAGPSNLAQQLEAVDAEADALLSSFDSIRKKREIKEMEEEQKAKAKEEANLLVEKNRLEQLEKDRLESEARLDEMRANVIRENKRAEEAGKAEEARKAAEVLAADKLAKSKKEASIKAKKKAKADARAKAKARERWIKKEKVRKKAVAKKKKESVQAVTVAKPKPKKVSTQDHLNSILGDN